MAEVAGVLSVYENVKSCIAIAQSIYSILVKAKDAPQERQQYLDVVDAVIHSLESLPRRLEDAQKGNSWSQGLLALVEPAKRFVPDKASSEAESPEGILERWGHKIDGGFAKIGLDGFVPGEKKLEPKGTYYYDADGYAATGILKRLEGLLRSLSEKLKPRTSIKGASTRLIWYWTDKEVKRQIDDIVGLRNNIDSLLAKDQYDLSMANQFLAKDSNARIKDVQETQRHEVREKEREKIMAWLSPLEFYKRQDAVFKDSFPTGQWLFDSPEFRAWILGKPWTLWCYGDPGAGKTVLCSNVINYLQRTYSQRRVLVLFLYLDYKEKDKQTSINLIGSLVMQLIQHQHFGFRSEKLKAMYEASRGEAQPNRDDMIEVLQEELKAYSGVYLIIDGWNDATDEVKMQLEIFLPSLDADYVSTMVTSRCAENEFATSEISCSVCRASNLSIYFHCDGCEQYDLCQGCVDKQESCGISSHRLEEPYDQVSVLVKATDDEIRRYVEWELEEQTKHDETRRRDKRTGSISLSSMTLARRLEQKPSLKQKIPDEISRKAKGMYLLARLYIDSMKTMLNVREIENALMVLPENLDIAYAEKMERIVSQRPKRYANWAIEALYWITCTHRPLRFKELQQALGAEVGKKIYDPDEAILEADIISVTAGLVTIDYDKSAVRIHVTFHDYLQEHREKWFPRAELDIAETIVTFLNFEGLDERCNENQVQARLNRLPLLSYGSQYWGDHVSRVCLTPDIQAMLLDFLSNSGKLESSLQAAFYLDSKIHPDIDARKGVNGLHMAAFYGLDLAITNLVNTKGIPIDSIDPKYGQTALMYACRRGHITAVTKLLDLGASVNIRSARETTAFLEAYLQASEMCNQVAKLLLARENLDVNVPYINDYGRTALMIAAGSGDEELVDLLLQRPDLDTNHQDQEGDTALSLAVSYRKSRIVELLLGHPGVDVDLPNKVGSSPLIIAARSGDADIVNQLLNKGAKTSIQDREGGGTALLRAVDEGHLEVIQVFLDQGIDFHNVDDGGRSLLHGASVNGHEEVVSLLLKARLDKNARGNQGETALHDASREGYSEVAKVLLDAGADRTIQDKHGRLPAEVAWQNGHTRTLRLFEGTNDDAKAADGETLPRAELLPTWSLAKLAFTDLIRQRIAQTSPELSDHDPDTGDTALHFAVANQQQEILKLLLKAQVSPDLTNHLKRTPLHLAAFHNQLESTEILLHSTPKPQLDLPDAWGATPLSTAQNLERYYIAVALINAEAQIDDSNRSHIQPTFFAAVELGNANVVEQLITKGADHLRPNAYGMTAKQIARSNDDVTMLRTLDTHRSDYFAFRSDSQRSEDYASATSSLYTPGLASTPNIASSSSVVAQSVTSPTASLEPLPSPDLQRAAFRPRPPVAA